MPITINLFLEGDISLPCEGMSAAKIKSAIRKGCASLDLDSVSVSFILTDDKVIREINRDYRKKDYATDVISFAYRESPFPAPKKGKEPLGDVYLSLEKAKAQAIEYGVTFHEEMIRLIVHALCHLVGYDHERSRKDEQIMRKKEDEVMSVILG
jgi:probable rRNA maturation factor